MTDYGNLDGELDDEFLNIGGETVVGMVATNATNNVYPELNEDLSPFDDYDFSDASGIFSGTIFDKKERARRRAARQKRRDAREAARNAEKLSRAELNKGLASDKQSDIELAKALRSDNSRKVSSKKAPMSTTTKVLIGVGVVALLAGIGFVVYKKSKK